MSLNDGVFKELGEALQKDARNPYLWLNPIYNRRGATQLVIDEYVERADREDLLGALDFLVAAAQQAVQKGRKDGISARLVESSLSAVEKTVADRATPLSEEDRRRLYAVKEELLARFFRRDTNKTEHHVRTPETIEEMLHTLPCEMRAEAQAQWEARKRQMRREALLDYCDTNLSWILEVFAHQSRINEKAQSIIRATILTIEEAIGDAESPLTDADREQLRAGTDKMRAILRKG